jgi:hypothetical protein
LSDQNQSNSFKNKNITMIVFMPCAAVVPSQLLYLLKGVI